MERIERKLKMKNLPNEARIASFGRRFLVAVLAVSVFAATANADKLPDNNQNVQLNRPTRK